MSKVTAKSAVFSQLRFIVNECYDNDKKEVVPFRYFRWDRKLSNNAENFFKDLSWLLLETDYMTDETKCYLLNPWLPIKGVVNELRLTGRNGKSLNANTVQTQIYRCRERFVKDFGNEVLSDILEANDRNIDRYRNVLDGLMVKYGKVDIIKLTALKGEFEKPEEIRKDISDEDFDYFIEMVMPYTERVMDVVLKEMDKDVLGYANFILNNPSVKGRELERREELINRLGLKTLVKENKEV